MGTRLATRLFFRYPLSLLELNLLPARITIGLPSLRLLQEENFRGGSGPYYFALRSSNVGFEPTTSLQIPRTEALIGARYRVVDYQHVARCCRFERLQEGI